MRPLSYSSISTYIECPLKFKLKYIDGYFEKPKPYFSFGSSLHDALEFMYSFRPPPPSLEDVLKYFEKNWISKGYASEEEEEGYFSYGKEILREYYRENIKDLKPPVAVEYKFDIEIDGIPVTGYIDRIDKLEGGSAEIIDYKSGKNVFDKSQVEKNEQLTLYQIAVEDSIGMDVAKLTLYHLPSQTPVSVDSRDKNKMEKLKRKIHEVSENIAKGNFEAKRGRFCPCDFPEHCPFYKHLYIKEDEVLSKKRVNIQQTIEEFSELKEKERELKKKIKDLAEDIHVYCEENDLARIFSDAHSVSRIKTERKGFDETKLKEILEPLGLWEKVLTFDDSLTSALLSDDSIEEQLKAEIRRLEEVKKTYYQLRVKEIDEEAKEKGNE
jgi:RecB family exonuclease